MFFPLEAKLSVFYKL